MSQFTTPAVLELLDNYKWRLVEPFRYYTEHMTACFDVELIESGYCLALGHVINVPVDYVTDLTSVPRALWSIFPPNGRYAKAAIVHDYLYSNALGSKAWADKVFLEAMTVLNVPWWRRHLMYWAVRWFGRGAYAVAGVDVDMDDFKKDGHDGFN